MCLNNGVKVRRREMNYIKMEISLVIINIGVGFEFWEREMDNEYFVNCYIEYKEGRSFIGDSS